MVYHEYMQNQYSGVCYVYKCSTCGSINEGTVTVGVTMNYNDRGVWSQKGMDQRRQVAERRARKSLEKKKKKALEKIKNRDYKYLDLMTKCRKCGNQEKWADPGLVVPKWLEWLRGISIIPIFPPVILLTWYLIDKYTGINAYLGVGILIFISACLFAVPHITYRIRCNKAAREYLSLPEASLPHAFYGTRKTAIDNARHYYLENGLATEEDFDDLEAYNMRKEEEIAAVMGRVKITRP